MWNALLAADALGILWMWFLDGGGGGNDDHVYVDGGGWRLGHLIVPSLRTLCSRSFLSRSIICVNNGSMVPEIPRD